MKHAGKARQAGLKMIYGTLIVLISFLAGGLLGWQMGGGVLWAAAGLTVVWAVFVLFAWNFFRDPDPNVPEEPDVIVSPGHGTVDLIEETTEPEFLGGACRRVSIFLSVIDVHVQRAPVGGRIGLMKHCPGKFVNAMRSDCGLFNENLLIGFESSERQGEKIAIRLIAGFLARRIIPWITTGDQVARGERISLIQFGSRVDVLLPLEARVAVKLGQKVHGGETVIARRK